MSLDYTYFVYFLIHTPITVLMDATFVIPTHLQLPLQRTLAEFHISTNKDYLAQAPPAWMQAFVAWELVFQLPFFLVAAYNFLHNARKGYSRNLYVWFLLYGFNAGFTSLICVVEILANGSANGLSLKETITLALVYLPTTIVPFVMMADFMSRITRDLTTKKSV